MSLLEQYEIELLIEKVIDLKIHHVLKRAVFSMISEMHQNINQKHFIVRQLLLSRRKYALQKKPAHC